MVENRKADLTGDITIGEPKNQKFIGTVKLWTQPNTDKLKRKYSGFAIIDGKYSRLHIYNKQ